MDDLKTVIRRAGEAREAGCEDEARALYLDAWERAQWGGDAYHACVAAHMLGVSEPMPFDEKLRWHLVSLEWADLVTDGRSAPFYASIFSNLGYVYAHTDRRAEAHGCYLLAREHTAALPDDEYGRSLREQIAWALGQLGERDRC